MQLVLRFASDCTFTSLRFASLVPVPERDKNLDNYDIQVNGENCRTLDIIEGLFNLMKKPQRNYVNNSDFYDAVVKYQKLVKEAKETGKSQPIIPNYIGECILKIAERLSTKPCFSNYSFKNEMISDGIINGIASVLKFDASRSNNAFSYFTTIIYNSFIGRINTEEKSRYAVCKSLQNSLTNGSDYDLFVDRDGRNVITKNLHDNVNDFISKFENKEKNKRERRRIKKATNINDQNSTDN